MTVFVFELSTVSKITSVVLKMFMKCF